MRRLTIKSGEKLTFANRTWNDCYADEDRNACIRSVDGTSQDLRSFIKELWCKVIDKDQVFPDDDDEFDDWLEEYMQYETAEGLLAYLYKQMYSKSDLQNTLKYYEDKEERLTFADDSGNWGLNGYDIKKVPQELYGAMCKLRDYEKSDMTPYEVMEVKALRTPLNPSMEGDGNIVYDTWACPNCGKEYEVEYEEYKFCPECGQAMKWEE